MIGIEPEVIAELIGEQYKGKEKLLKPNLNAFQHGPQLRTDAPEGRDGAEGEARGQRQREHLHRRQRRRGAGLRVRRRHRVRLVPDHAFVFACRGLHPHCRALRVDKETGKNKFAIIQAEDELASIGIVTGAGWNGARAFTATSGPGISLMCEFIGLAYFAEIPVTIIDVQRGGPSTGMPTRTQQSDVLLAPTPRTATPSTSCCSRKIRTSASSSPRSASTSPTASRRRCS